MGARPQVGYMGMGVVLDLDAGGVTGGQGLQLDHQVSGAVVSAELYGPGDHRGPAVCKKTRF